MSVVVVARMQHSVIRGILPLCGGSSIEPFGEGQPLSWLKAILREEVQEIEAVRQDHRADGIEPEARQIGKQLR